MVVQVDLVPLGVGTWRPSLKFILEQLNAAHSLELPFEIACTGAALNLRDAHVVIECSEGQALPAKACSRDVLVESLSRFDAAHQIQRRSFGLS